MFYITGVINCISASSDGQVMCSTAEDKSLKVFDVVNFGTLTMFLPSATNIISLAGTTCSKGGYVLVNNCIAKWRLGVWNIQGLPLLAASP